MGASIISVDELLRRPLAIPNYQRPYTWSVSGVSSLLEDIDKAMFDARKIDGYRYRIGTVIVHAHDGILDVVDGQQRIITLLLLALCISPSNTNRYPLLQAGRALNGRASLENVQRNYLFIKDWLRGRGPEYCSAMHESMSKTLEAVVLEVYRLPEAFQLFDSQNTRGKELYPHDLLKAYHLRAMSGEPYDMRHVVTRWEAFPAEDVGELFSDYLHPVSSWARKEKPSAFTAGSMDAFKGVSPSTGYTYAERARQAMPFYQIGEPFLEGRCFFEMTERYLTLLEDIQAELSREAYSYIRTWLERSNPSTGLRLVRLLFVQAVLCYYDKFKNFDEQAMRKVFLWAFSLRVDMEHLGVSTINKYAIGENTLQERYTNAIPMFSLISKARLHTEVSNLMIRVPVAPRGRMNAERAELAQYLMECVEGRPA